MRARIGRLALLALASLAVLVAFIWLQTTADHDAGPELPDASAAQRDRAAAASAQPTDEAPSTRVAAVDAGTTRAEGPATGLANVRGRCVAAEDQRPLAGIRVSFRGRAADRELARLHGEEPLGLPDPFVTGEDGRFELRFTAYPHFSHTLILGGDDRATRHGTFAAFAPDAIKELGDIQLTKCFAVAGFVTDQHGTVVPDVGISLSHRRLPDRIGPPEPSTVSGGGVFAHGTSDAAGAFTVRGLTPGTWRLDVPGHAFEHIGPKEIEVVPGVGAAGVHVIVRRRLSIEGNIVDEDGAPVDLGANLIAWSRRGQLGGAGVQTTVAKDGVFKLVRLIDDPDEPVQIGWESTRLREGFRSAEWIEWGARGVRLVAKRLPGLELEVLEAGTGKPVEEFAVRAWSEADPDVTVPRNPGRSPGGRTRLDGLAPGETLIEVIPKRTDLLTSAPLRVLFSGASRGPFRIELLRARTFAVRVLAADRSPVPGALVELLDPRQVPRITHDTTAADDRLAHGPGGPGVTVSGGSRELRLTLLSWGTTDTQGRAALHGPAMGPRFALRVSPREHVPRIVDDLRIPGENGEVEVVVASGAGLDFVALPSAAVAYERCGISLRKVGEPWLTVYPTQHTSYLFAADGIARARLVPAGTWEVRLVTKDAAPQTPLATVTLAEGKTERLEVDLSRLAPVRLAGKVTWNGARPVTGTVTLASATAQVNVPMEISGRFVAERVLPGTYEVSADLMMEKEQVRCAHDRLVELTPGADLDIWFDFRRRILRLRVLQHDETPAGDVSGDVAGAYFSVKFMTDERGEVRVAPLPGPKVRVTASNRVVFEGQVPPGAEPELTVRLPAPEAK